VFTKKYASVSCGQACISVPNISNHISDAIAINGYTANAELRTNRVQRILLVSSTFSRISLNWYQKKSIWTAATIIKPNVKRAVRPVYWVMS
jgi:hypothetical protein